MPGTDHVTTVLSSPMSSAWDRWSRGCGPERAQGAVGTGHDSRRSLFIHKLMSLVQRFFHTYDLCKPDKRVSLSSLSAAPGICLRPGRLGETGGWEFNVCFCIVLFAASHPPQIPVSSSSLV